ncbi:Transposon Ty3-I Gag-Pol polyprotein [Thelohanellus kitauei]|uniref:Transposon Ty3-I Gag-Pol polyprotein n=1 Tax=Thelohanellus kitauei TaxID=669202 RepID=A0A0C2ITC6_THEKT|nr:Transposon Ty3-I Gag-Pol polyprotein [Thelohanellus kitauei]
MPSYEFNVMRFGLTNAPVTFNRLMDAVISNIKGCICYIDDLLIFAESLEEHNKILKSVLDRLEECGLMLSLKKCQFGVDDVDYHGLTIINNRIKRSHSHLGALVKWKIPNTKKNYNRS